eukprot:GHVP01010985.1.p1 GENE.GHVP01010985.1~~GHVP01010985.1.p1  ORF type:complete len:1829 (-),score=311.05 GHVP01010985.1:51-5462(-)
MSNENVQVNKNETPSTILHTEYYSPEFLEEGITLRIDKLFACRWFKFVVDNKENYSDPELKQLMDSDQVAENTHLSSSQEINEHSSRSKRRKISISSITPILSDNPTSSCSSKSDIEPSEKSCRGKVRPDLLKMIDFDKQIELFYLTKFEERSYLDLYWIPGRILIDHFDGKSKIKFFHKDHEVSENEEVPINSADTGNFSLFSRIDCIIGVRPLQVSKKTWTPSLAWIPGVHFSVIPETKPSQYFQKRYLKSPNKGVDLGKLEYLVKWELQGYASTTWELEERVRHLQNGSERISEFEEINESFSFPRSRKKKQKKTSIASNDTETPTIKEDYSTVETEEGQSNLWKLFLNKIDANSNVYTPSTLSRNSSIQPTPRRLMRHQKEGLKWIFYNTEKKKHGSLLADEMGLGKTCQAITYLEHYLDVMSAGRSQGAHALVVAQKSVIENWRREFRQWTPHLHVVALVGSKMDRELCIEFETKWLDIKTGKKITPPSTRQKLIKPDVLLVSYETLRGDEFKSFVPRSSNFSWAVLVVDECQKAKGGTESRLLLKLSSIKRESTILLTGTPIQNNVEEIFPLLTLVHPQLFSYTDSSVTWTQAAFETKFADLQIKEDALQLASELHTLIAPYVLRREKSVVLKSLPQKAVKIIRIPLTLIQKRIYSALYHKSIKSYKFKTANIHMQLRKCCVHPYLIDNVEDLLLSGKLVNIEVGMPDGTVKSIDQLQHIDAAQSFDNNAQTDSPCLRVDIPNEQSLFRSLLRESSGKFVLLEKLLLRFREDRRKVLIFSYFKRALDLVEDLIHDYDWAIERVDGDTSGENRQLFIDRFNDPNCDRFVFLCTTRAGGVGINLATATVVIHLDSDFNPQVDMQAQARAHRIGQEKHVDVFHFICEHTYEDYIFFNVAGKKLGLEQTLLGRYNDRGNKRPSKVSKEQEEAVLRKGVYAALRDDEAARNDASSFASSTVDEILKNKTSDFVIGGEIKDAAENIIKREELDDHDEDISTDVSLASSVGASCFATAKFQDVQKDDQDIGLGLDEGDPEFWEKVVQRLGAFKLGDEEKTELTRADRRKGKNITYTSGHSGGEHENDLEDDEDSGSDTTPYRKRDRSAGDEEYESPQWRAGDNDSDASNSSSGDSVRTVDNLSDNVQRPEVCIPQTSRKGAGRPPTPTNTPGSQGVFTVTVPNPHLMYEFGANEVKDLSSVTRQRFVCEVEKEGQSKLVFQGIQSGILLARRNIVPNPESSPPRCKDSPPNAAPAPPPECVGMSPIEIIHTITRDSERWPPKVSKKSAWNVVEGDLGFDSTHASELCFRCLMSIRAWKESVIAQAVSGGIRVEDVRLGDCLGPWRVFNVPDIQELPVIAGFTLLSDPEGRAVRRSMWTKIAAKLSKELEFIQSAWATTMSAWDEAGQVFCEVRHQLYKELAEERKAEIGDGIETSIEIMQNCPETAKYIARRLHVLCDCLAYEVLVGRNWCRDSPSKKQTWLGSEDLSIKLMFLHFARLQLIEASTQVKVGIGVDLSVHPGPLTWPPPSLEVHWQMLTTVVNMINKYLDGPERRKDVLINRFYNKLDHRWKFDDLQPSEIDLCVKLVAEGAPVYAIAKALPNRNVDTTKLLMKHPQVEAQASQLNKLRNAASAPAGEALPMWREPTVIKQGRPDQLFRQHPHQSSHNLPLLQAHPRKKSGPYSEPVDRLPPVPPRRAPPYQPQHQIPITRHPQKRAVIGEALPVPVAAPDNSPPSDPFVQTISSGSSSCSSRENSSPVNQGNPNTSWQTPSGAFKPEVLLHLNARLSSDPQFLAQVLQHLQNMQ